MERPLAIDLFCGLGGWTDGLLAEGYDVIGFDIERHVYGSHRYPAQLVIQDVRTLHGSQFKDAALIVASPPCQKYSYMAMPWKRSKAMAAAIRADTTGKMLAELNCLFDACFRIQAQASLAAGRPIPLIVENVKGAQKWVGRARWSFGSFYLWGDVPALMPPVRRAAKVPGMRFDGRAQCFQQAAVEYIKNGGGSWFRILHNRVAPHRGDARDLIALRHTPHMTNPAEHRRDPMAASSGVARKIASAMIAKIPLPLSRHIGAVFRPSAN